MSVTWIVSAAVCQGNVVVQFLLARVDRLLHPIEKCWRESHKAGCLVVTS